MVQQATVPWVAPGAAALQQPLTQLVVRQRPATASAVQAVQAKVAQAVLVVLLATAALVVAAVVPLTVVPMPAQQVTEALATAAVQLEMPVQ